jgi:hypothetical protein
VKRIHAAAAAALVVLAVPALTGCFSGQAATTSMQATMNSGNGVEATQGAINVDGAVLVLGPEGSGTGTLTTRLVNAGLEPDALTYVSINGIPAYVTEGAGELVPGASISFGYESDAWINSYDLDVPASTYVPVELGFEKAGLVKMSLLTVPAAGYYEGIAPNPAANPVAAS